LEQDTARTLSVDKDLQLKTHFFDEETGKNHEQVLPSSVQLIDLNRAGIGLMEIVTEPDLTSAHDSYSFVRELALLLSSYGTTEAKIGEGGLRVDVNVSVHKLDKNRDENGDYKLLPSGRVEVKNVGSFSSILKATQYEIKRQKLLITKGETIKNETRTFDFKSGQTKWMRSKEDQYDYRFMPEPNLLPFVIYPSKSFSQSAQTNDDLLYDSSYLEITKQIKDDQRFFVDLDKVRDEFLTKQNPDKRRHLMVNKYGLTIENAFVFIANDLDLIFIKLMNQQSSTTSSDFNNDSKIYSKILLRDYLSILNKRSDEIIDLNQMDIELKCKKLISFGKVIKESVISTRITNNVFKKLFEKKNLNKLAIDIIREEDLFIVNDSQIINECIQSLFSENQKQVTALKTNPVKNKNKIFDFFAGRIHKKFNDKTDPKLVDELLLKSLDSLIVK
jgi:aspartyl-tRNA(Asn)/glutamyl-tRNA(Gln) amidotransferase subunit B